MTSTLESFEIPESELLEFLNAMESEDLVNEADDNAAEEDLELQEVTKKSSYASMMVAQKRKERDLRITREAFDQKLIDLNMVLPKEHGQLLIKELAVKYDKQIARNRNFASNRVKKLIMARTPIFLRKAFKRAPQAFKKHPGFMYHTNKVYNKEYILWIDVDGPYYMEQGTETEALHKFYAKYVKSVDKAIYNIHRYEALKQQMMIDVALQLAHMKRSTYFELLKLKPMWFKTLYDALRAAKVKKIEGQTYVNDLW